MAKGDDEDYVRPNVGARSNPPWLFEPGATRWRRMRRSGDTGDAAEQRGWVRTKHLLKSHPLTGAELLGGQQWWIKETKE